jgi:hypothetical protein
MHRTQEIPPLSPELTPSAANGLPTEPTSFVYEWGCYP